MKSLRCSLQGPQARQTTAAVIVSFGMMTYGFIGGWLAPTVELFMSESSPVKMTDTELSWVMGAANLGAVFGPVPSVFLMDRLGRKYSLLLLNTLPVVGWALIYYARNFQTLFLARCVAGTWLGVTSTLVPNYICEITDPALRSSLNTLPTFLQRAGVLTVFLFGSQVSYRSLPLVGLFFCVVFWLLMLLVPESPYFYCLKSKKIRALEALKWLHGDENFQERFNRIDKFIEAGLYQQGSLMDILRNPTHLKTFTVVILASVLVMTSGGTLIVIVPLILPKRAFFSLGNQDCATVLALFNLLFSFRPRWLSCIGNRPLLTISSVACGVCMAVMATWHYLDQTSDFGGYDVHWVPFVSYFVFMNFFSFGVHPVVNALRGEMFPTQHKAVMAGVVAIFGGVFLTVTLYLFIPIQRLGAHYNFVIASVSCFCLAMLTYCCIIETGGKSLEDIQSELHHHKRRAVKF